jgi:dTDP-glucose pyrophosphorylase/predicted transcriptional regulator
MNNWKSTILTPNNSMQEAIALLDKVETKIIMVADKKSRLIGTVTDGDIRRALINHFEMDTMLSEIMFDKPTTVSANDGRRKILAIMKEKDILQVPLVDKNNKIIGLEVISNLLKSSRYDNPVFLMAGGLGKRLKPLTDDTPKPLLKIGSKPILETILHQFIDAGFHNFFISTHYKADMVSQHFGDGKKWNVSIEYVHEDSPLGTAGALGLLPSDINNLPIIMMNGDLLTNVDFSSLLKFHNEQNSIATMCVSEYDFQVPYGVVELSNQKVVSIAEKPMHKFFINSGIYVIDNSLLSSLDGKSPMDMPQLLENQIKENIQVSVFPIHEYWLDIGQIEHLEKAKIDSKRLFE